ncbi:hypothetical protein SNEBB_005262 [Seison nebaliae]|nr:hypothetical protein SNEBB_005262 [Seison nebaliae]
MIGQYEPATVDKKTITQHKSRPTTQDISDFYTLLPDIRNYNHNLDDNVLNNRRQHFAKGVRYKVNPYNFYMIKPGFDDFRDGYPPPVDKEIVPKPTEAAGPFATEEEIVLKTKELYNSRPGKLTPKQRFSKWDRCFSKVGILSGQRKALVEQKEHALMRHPLALFSNYEESLPAELFREVVECLDEEMFENLENEDRSLEFGYGRTKAQQRDEERREQFRIAQSAAKNRESAYKRKFQVVMGSALPEGKENNSFYQFLKKEQRKKKTIDGIEPVYDATIEPHIEKITAQFCKWVTSLGGDHNIDPATLTSLFASGYETKPALSVPVHVVELTNVPHELRGETIVGENMKNILRPFKSTPPHLRRSRKVKGKKGYAKDDIYDVRDYRYGAWYIPVNDWTYQLKTQSLADPTTQHHAQREAKEKRNHDLNEKLANLHGTKLFKDFVLNEMTNVDRTFQKPVRMPKLLDDVENHRELKRHLPSTRPTRK